MKKLMAPQKGTGKLKKLAPKKTRTKRADANSSKAKKSLSAPPTPPTPILRLPAEIVYLIFELLDLPEQLSLNRASRFFYFILNHTIYLGNVRFGNSTCLFWGAENGELGTLKHALAAGATPNMTGPIDRKCSDNSSDGSDNNDNVPANANGTPDIDAIADGDTDDVQGDTERIADESRLAPWGTPLHLAAKKGHRDVVEWLLDNGADINAPSFRVCECQSLKTGRHPLHPIRRLPEWPRWRALHTAMCSGERLVAELLIFRGASQDLDATAGHSHTALHSAASNALIPVIKLLALEGDLDVNERDTAENTALHYVSELWYSRESDEIRDTVTKLLALGAELEAHNEAGHTPLLNACHRGNFAAALRLVSIGANPEPHRLIPNFRDVRPLYYCTLPRAEFFDLDDAPVKHDEFEGNRVSLIKALVDAGADVEARFNKRSHHNVTTLMMACELAEPRAVAALLSCGASVNSQDRAGRTPLSYACTVRVDHRGEVPEIASILLRKGARLDLEEDAVNNPLEWGMKQMKWGENDVLETMLKVSDKMNLRHSKLKSALRNCAFGGNYKALKALLKFADRTYGVSDEDFKDCMDLTIDQNDPWHQRDTFNCLMDFGRRVDSTELLLLKTILRQNRDLSLAVLERGVSVSDVRFYGGQTYLHLACHWGDRDVVRALVERGADVNVFDDQLRTPLSIAVEENFEPIAVCLMKEVADPHLVPPDDLLSKIFDDEDECRFVKKRYQTAFDIAIRDNRDRILSDMLSRFEMPAIRLGTKYSYVHRACQGPNTNILKILLKKGADPNGGKDCPVPPLMSLLSNIWSAPRRPDVATAALQMARLLFLCHTEPSAAHTFALEILQYDGPDEDKRALSQRVKKELGAVVSEDGGKASLRCLADDELRKE
ncbi:ankyrin repeat-containing domain protein [Podospora didyma]|uniref:Ankyrin repeat-containing domain protein n=1 Tax=Podospora didyma TaxID=330526 RepID=A0AAE0NY38_9PEZI|nr:ankyrin repeat-containing domain protein [Podospora didyma]